MHRNSQTNRERGAIVVTILLIMLFFTATVAGLLLLSNATLERSRSRVLQLEAQYAAESGADAAIATLNYSNSSFTGSSSDVTVLTTTRYKATYATSISGSNTTKIITSTGKIYQPATAASPSYTRTILVTIQQTSSTSASGLMSTNNLYIASSVKGVSGSSIYLNGFVKLTKNTNVLTFSSLTVAGKDTGASNCSIEGSGSLGNASAPAKATIDVAYNNCITPPGNSSNSNFTVTANDGSATPLQSLYIPWSQYMDSSYTAAGNCGDWTVAGTITIPSAGNAKKTHYPDSGSGVSSSCGTSGSINLGSKTVTITDNAHIRANLCSSSACTPTFNNTSGSLKFLFVEGTVNFNSLTTTAGSSPIVIFAYGADPGSHGSNACPYGDAAYLGNSGQTAAPAIYLLALNGVCIDSTKFGASQSLAGLGGKNLYIATNSGTPYPLGLNTGFPLSQIPVNLTWKATGYERR